MYMEYLYESIKFVYLSIIKIPFLIITLHIHMYIEF